MTAQKHIDAIGEALVDVEDANEDVRKSSRRLTRALDRLHKALDAGQVAYQTEHGGNVVAFSGGTNKPPADPNPDPLPPPPGS